MGYITRVLSPGHELKQIADVAALLAGRLVFTPRGDGRKRFYEVSGPGTLDKVIAGMALPKGLVTPTGFEPVFESRPRFTAL
jgi:hypothetical protein